MDSPKTLATMVPQDTGNNGPTRHWQQWSHKTLATMVPQDTGRRQLKKNTKKTKNHNSTQKTKKMRNRDPTKTRGVNSVAR